ncbi:serine/threonine-protein kinase [Calothrix sp. 336/3]|uniref:serine/threonine-protein kinase n=1 Tax=Calothrix sp. 336/3 TaxID=1337936 RepID=UPI0004E2973C|nr:serine/threonine-protein kinase [Calothrix sp. 336/3]AKG22036.1 protein kinase [Calothrix sp. 336/3]
MLGQLLDGRYKIIKVLGAGGFGQTFIAEDTKLYNTQCVVKQLKPQSADSMTLQIARRLFESEAQLLHKLGSHDQIPRLLAHFEENREFFLVQEFIDGHPLNQELIPGNRFDEGYAIALIQDILQPLAFVHDNNVIHRDIKPPNLIRRKSDNKVVLIDFGAVKQIGTQVVGTDGVTKMTVSIGTPGYMPSEQSRGSPRLSSDIFAVGMIGIQALTGFMPNQLHEDIQTAEILWRNLVVVNPVFADILDRMIRYDFRQRFQSAREALTAIQQLTPHSSTSNIPISQEDIPTQISSTPRQINPTQYNPPTPPGISPNPVPNQNLYSPPPTVPPQYRQEVTDPTIASTPGNFVGSDRQLTPPSPPIQPQPLGWGFYLQWVLVNLGGIVGGFIIAYVACQIVKPLGAYPYRLSFSIPMGLALGGAQSLLLQPRVPFPSWWWTASTPLAFSLAILICGKNPYDALFYIGPILGVMQWLILRQYFRQTGWWILLNTLLGWTDFGLISGLIISRLLQRPKGAI